MTSAKAMVTLYFYAIFDDQKENPTIESLSSDTCSLLNQIKFLVFSVEMNIFVYTCCQLCQLNLFSLPVYITRTSNYNCKNKDKLVKKDNLINVFIV